MKSNPQAFPQNVIAVIWDFDKTLIPGYMQEPIFQKYNVKEKQFWKEVREAVVHYRTQKNGQVSSEIVYLNQIIDYVKDGRFAGLNNQGLQDMGQGMEFFPGLPDFFGSLKQELSEGNDCKPEYQQYEIKLEHYVISTGLRQIILGSQIAPHLDGVWGCELLEELNSQGEPELAKIGYVLDHTTKTRAIFEINKGANKRQEHIDVNARMLEEHRRVPISNMVYIADGPSDVPVFSVVKRYGGRNLAVHPPSVSSHPHNQQVYDQVFDLQKDGRVDHMGPADFTADSTTTLWLKRVVHDIADQIVNRQETVIKKNVGKAPRHL